MKKSTKIILWITGITAIIILPDANLYYQNIILKLDRLPKAYRNYSALADLKDDKYEVVDFFGAEPLLQLNDSTIAIIAVAKQNDNDILVQKTWYKINLRGIVIDSLKLSYKREDDKHFYKTFNSYIVDIGANTYNTWLIDSDTTWKPIKNLQPNKVYDSKEVEKMISADNYVHSAIIQLKNGEELNHLIFFKDKGFHAIFVEENWTKLNDPINKLEVRYESLGKDTVKESSTVKRVYVQKEQWMDTSVWKLSKYTTMWTGGGLGRKRWEGTAYYDLQLPKKTLHFKEEVTIEYPDQYVREPFKYKIYKPNNGDYQILSEGEYFTTYLIRPKLNIK
ncbi:hypothetical protein EZJ43_13380 [Pedobacter changchengzhani]|uniref:Uncharacterized protein n=1 Tax=Pedobacter changchengzhani TaxID=2529274 RepID=A0A4R5MJM9_9SPHI|nr:hypothetical protein [Pedobacter changchengzhani]TDG35606.1 hypothetical protein EZJ43_13380 [Pedobacter changchengzhani]